MQTGHSYIPQGRIRSYRFGFNGKEKINEQYGEGNAYDFGARMLDPRIGRWMKMDPKDEKYPYLSPYSAFADNPLIFIDLGGETLGLGGNIEQANIDIFSLLPKEVHSYLNVSDVNNIKWNNYDAMPDEFKKYEGVKLVDNLINSKNNYLYSVGNEIPLKDKLGNEYIGEATPDPSNYQTTISNISTTPQWSDAPSESQLPGGGYSGIVRLAEGSWSSVNAFEPTAVVPIPRANIVFHELTENYYRTEKNLPKQEDYSYALGGGMYYSESYYKTNYKGGAHQKAAETGPKFARQMEYDSAGNTGISVQMNWSPPVEKK